MTFSAVAVLLAVVASTAPQAQAGGRREGRHLFEALHEMEKAVGELRETKHNFEGHREKAIHYLEDAIQQTKRVLREAGIKVEKVDVDPKVYPKGESYKHLRRSLQTIREARTELRDTKRFGTDEIRRHRDRAIEDLNHAEEQVEKCLKNAR
jgi:hypothetical protein